MCIPSNSSIISIFRNKILKMNVVMFEISTANPKEYTLLFYSNNLFILIRKYLASLEILHKKYLLPTKVRYINIYNIYIYIHIIYNMVIYCM